MHGRADQRRVVEVVFPQRRGPERIELAFVAGAEPAHVQTVTFVICRERELGSFETKLQTLEGRAFDQAWLAGMVNSHDTTTLEQRLSR